MGDVSAFRSRYIFISHEYLKIYLGKEYRPEVTCIDGICKAKNPNIRESCPYICGKSTCDHIGKSYY